MLGSNHQTTARRYFYTFKRSTFNIQHSTTGSCFNHTMIQSVFLSLCSIGYRHSPKAQQPRRQSMDFPVFPPTPPSLSHKRPSPIPPHKPLSIPTEASPRAASRTAGPTWHLLSYQTRPHPGAPPTRLSPCCRSSIRRAATKTTARAARGFTTCGTRTGARFRTCLSRTRSPLMPN